MLSFRLSHLLCQVQFGGNNFDGTLPTEIGLLTHMAYLDLASCATLNMHGGLCAADIGSITGTIPTEIGNLIHLTLLRFH